MPFLEFWALYGAIGANCARERLDFFRAIANALACAFAEKGAPMVETLRDDLAAAYAVAPDPAEAR